MREEFSRTELLLGSDAMTRLANAHVAIFGIGGVGGYACEALARSGIGTFGLIDNDTVDITNINRQIIATQKSIGKAKVDVMRERILAINPEATVVTHKCFFLPENANDFPFENYDYVIDAVDTVTAKLALITKCQEIGVPCMSSMGAGNKLDPTAFRVADIFDTSIDPLTRIMRKELRKRGVNHLKVVYSTEPPLKPNKEESKDEQPIAHRKSTPGSTAFVPSVAGLIIASEVIKDLTTPK